MNHKLLDVAQLITATLRLTATPADIAGHVAAAGSIDWAALVDHADGHSLTPLLYDVWRQAGALDDVPTDIQSRLAQAYADNAERNVHIRRELVEVHQLLAQARVPHLVLKGWPLVERLYPNPAQRVLYDHDFLVPPDQAERGQRALLAAGFQPLPAKDEWIQKHLPPVWRNNGYHWDGYLFDPHYPRPVELHVQLWEQDWRGLKVDQLPYLWPRATTATVAGQSMQLLSDVDTLIHLAVHFAGHLIERTARLNQLLDLARFTQRVAYIDWERLWAQVTAANVGRFVYASLYLAHRIFDASLPPSSIWQRLTTVTPPTFRNWLTRYGPGDVLTADFRRPDKGQDYYLTLLAATSLPERLGIIRFAALPPLGQLMVKYRLRHRWQGPFFYPRYLAERVGEYGRAMLERGRA